jgi:integrase
MRKPKEERNLKFIDGKWYLDFTFNKKRIRRFGGYTKEQARNTLAKLRTEKLDEKLGYKKPGNQEDVYFERFAEDFINLYAKQNKRSWKRDVASLKNLNPFFKGKTIQGIGPELVERYKAKRKTEVSPGTVNRELAFLKTMFNKAVEWGRLDASPLKNVKKFKEPSSKDRILAPDEMKALIEAANGHLKPILIIALNTGMRRGEILGLKWENADLSKRHIHIEDSKSGKSRDIPMNRLVIEALGAIPQSSEYVFFNAKTGAPIQDVKTAFKSARENMNIKDLRFHDLRHTAAWRMVEAGVDLVTVSKILGHSSIQMTMRYCHPTPENMRMAVEKLGEIFTAKQKELHPTEKEKVTTPSFLIN